MSSTYSDSPKQPRPELESIETLYDLSESVPPRSSVPKVLGVPKFDSQWYRSWTNSYAQSIHAHQSMIELQSAKQYALHKYNKSHFETMLTIRDLQDEFPIVDSILSLPFEKRPARDWKGYFTLAKDVSRARELVARMQVIENDMQFYSMHYDDLLNAEAEPNVVNPKESVGSKAERSRSRLNDIEESNSFLQQYVSLLKANECELKRIGGEVKVLLVTFAFISDQYKLAVKRDQEVKDCNERVAKDRKYWSLMDKFQKDLKYCQETLKMIELEFECDEEVSKMVKEKVFMAPKDLFGSAVGRDDAEPKLENPKPISNASKVFSLTRTSITTACAMLMMIYCPRMNMITGPLRLKLWSSNC